MADITITVEPRAVPEIQVPAPTVPDVLVGGAVWSEILGKPTGSASAPHFVWDGNEWVPGKVAWSDLSGVPATFPPSAHGHDWGDLTSVPPYASRWPDWTEVANTPPQLPGSPSDGQFASWDAGAGQWVAVDAPSGGSGSPGGTDGQVQYNDAGSFGASERLTYDGETLRVQAEVGQTEPLLSLRDGVGTEVFRVQDAGERIHIGRQAGKASVKGIPGQGLGWLIFDGADDTSTMGLNYYTAGDVILANGGGKVGIGVPSPNAALDIVGTNLVLNGSGDTQQLILSTAAQQFEHYMQDGANWYGLYDRTTGAWRMGVSYSGNVGIGPNTSPDALLHVQGTLHGEGDATFDSNLDANAYSVGGAPGASGTFTTTDGKTVTVTNGLITAIA